MGIYSSSQFFGAFLGGIIGGYLAQQYGYVYLFAANAVLALLWLVLAMGMVIPLSSKRVSIAIDILQHDNFQKLIDDISACEGVIEATLIDDEHRIYLKVNKNYYDRNSVDQLIKQID